MSHITGRKHDSGHSRLPRPLQAASLLGMFLVAPVAQAATEESPSPVTLDQVKVYGSRSKVYTGESSSTKHTQALVDTTQTISVIGNDLFTEQGATSLTEALRNSPGVGTFYAGENGNTSTGDAVYLRGFDSSGNIFVDGVRDLGAISRDVFNVDQIEVTKGPAGTDTGRSTPTGAINLVTKHAALRGANSATLSIGSADQRRAVADYNQPLSAGTALRVNLMAQDSGVPGRDRVENNRFGIAASLGFGLDTATRTYFDVLHVRQDNVPDGWVSTIGLPGYSSPDPARPQLSDAPPVDSRNFYGTTSDFGDVTADMATLRVEHMGEDGTQLRNTTRWGSTSQQYMLTSFLGSSANLATPDLDDPTTWTIARSTPTFKDQRNTIVTNQTSLVTRLSQGTLTHDLSAGLELTRETLASKGVAVLDGTAWPAANLYRPDPDVTGLRWGRNGADGEGRTDTAALYLFDTVSVGQRWQFNGGVRMDRYRAEYHNRAVCGGTRGPACNGAPTGTVLPFVDARNSDTLFNWKVGALFKPTASSSLYANYAVSQQPPGGATLELSSAANSPNNPGYQPQKARTAEVGAKWIVSDGALLLTAALYDTRIENEVVLDPVDQRYYQNGEKRVRGIELGAVGELAENWWISAGVTTMDAKVVAGPDVAMDGSPQLAYTPDRAFTGWLTHRLASGLTLGGGARYVGGMKRGTDGAIGTPAYTQAYWVFDAVASYAFNEAVDVRLNLYNLADRDYVAAINKSGYRYSPGQPRSVLLSLNLRF